MRPRLLDLFCGGGGASAGYHRAGFDVVGVDIEPHPTYPFEFHQADALEFPLEGFDAIHASPPCQAYSAMSACRPGLADKYPALVEEVRERLDATDVPYVIENVPGAPLRNPVTLCGTMFGLKVYRHRLFETRPSIYFPPAVCTHFVSMPRAGRIHPDGWVSVAGSVRQAPARAAMGIDWMTGRELSEAIPPAYTEWVGRQLLASIEVAA